MSLTVLQVIPHIGAGGAEQACVDIAAALVKRGDRALVVSAGGRRLAEIEAAGAEHILLDVASKNPFKIIRNAYRLADIVRRENVDILHARSRAPAWSASIAARMTGRFFVTTFHAVYKFKSALKKKYNSVMAKGVRVIAISHYVAEHIQETYAPPEGTIKVIPRGLSLGRFDPAAVTEEEKKAIRAAWGIPENKKIILLPARLSPIKGHDVAIEAIARLPDFHRQNVLLVILGDDQGRVRYRKILEDKVRDLHLADTIRFVPHCASMQIAYALSDLVLVPSRVPEGFGRVPVEAMAMGVLPLASSLGATRETVVDGETGWLLNPFDVEAWSDAIQKGLSLTPAERAEKAKAGRERVIALYDDRKMIQNTLAVYDELKALGR